MSEFHDRLVHIAGIFDGGFDWSEWHAYYDPVSRMFYAGEDAGCSCNEYEIEYAVDQANGLHDRADLLGRLNAWVGSERWREREAAEVRAEILQFQRPKEGR